MNLSIIELAKILAFGSIGLTDEGLINYIQENERMIVNEKKMNRAPKKYLYNFKAGILALQMRGSHELAAKFNEEGIIK